MDNEVIRLSELDIEILYRIARGESYKEIALNEKKGLQTIKNRMNNVLHIFGARSLSHLIAILIASDVLRVHDLYQEFTIEVCEYKPQGWSRMSYRLEDVRP